MAALPFLVPPSAIDGQASGDRKLPAAHVKPDGPQWACTGPGHPAQICRSERVIARRRCVRRRGQFCKPSDFQSGSDRPHYARISAIGSGSHLVSADGRCLRRRFWRRYLGFRLVGKTLRYAIRSSRFAATDTWRGSLCSTSSLLMKSLKSMAPVCRINAWAWTSSCLPSAI